jgi:predicted ATPase
MENERGITMIEAVDFVNFKALRNTTLPLGRFTLLVGPNGSGKSTALQAFRTVLSAGQFNYQKLATVGIKPTPDVTVEITIRWGEPFQGMSHRVRWPAQSGHPPIPEWSRPSDFPKPPDWPTTQENELTRIRVYTLDASQIAAPVQLQPEMELAGNGLALAGVLDRLRDSTPERWKALNDELGYWFPEYDHVLFDTPGPGQRALRLRVRQGHHSIPAADLSQGTLCALAMLTLAYLPEPPPLVCFEEPDRGIHPRLLRKVHDALYRLSYPENFSEKRDPVQVLATTQSPYFLDLFKDHPEEIVIAEKKGLEAFFVPLAKRPDIHEILADAPLGEVWYSGVLGGVPTSP